VLTFFLLLSSTAFGFSRDNFVQTFGIDLKSPGVSVVSELTQAGAAKNQHTFVIATAAGARFEVKVIEPIGDTAANEIMEMQRESFRKAYGAAQTPYMGDIADALGACPASYGPLRTTITLNGHKVEALLGAAHASYSFGACDEKLAHFKAALFFLYESDSKNLWEWRAFVPWKQLGKGLGSGWLTKALGPLKKCCASIH
jgi:hypothetical protein